MPKTTVDRHVLLTSEQKTEVAELRAMGLTRSQAWRRVLTPEQHQVFYEQIRTAERLRYIKNPYREIIKRARRLRRSARRRGAKYNAWEFTITEDDLDWPTYCPVLPWIELHYPGRYRHDPAGASLDRINHEKCARNQFTRQSAAQGHDIRRAARARRILHQLIHSQAFALKLNVVDAKWAESELSLLRNVTITLAWHRGRL